MPRYIAFLRAINVGGHVVKMDALRRHFEAIKLKNVETFIASGNVIFETSSSDAEAIERRIEKHLLKSLGYEVGAFLRTPARLEEITRYAPFSEEDIARGVRSIQVGFLAKPPRPELQSALDDLRTDVDVFHVHDRELYWLCRGRMSDSLVKPALLGDAIAAPITVRNMNTIRRLVDKYAAR
jgi:uncharacterized protein (DUF1697 family)